MIVKCPYYYAFENCVFLCRRDKEQEKKIVNFHFEIIIRKSFATETNISIRIHLCFMRTESYLLFISVSYHVLIMTWYFRKKLKFSVLQSA